MLNTDSRLKDIYIYKNTSIHVHVFMVYKMNFILSQKGRFYSTFLRQTNFPLKITLKVKHTLFLTAGKNFQVMILKMV